MKEKKFKQKGVTTFLRIFFIIFVVYGITLIFPIVWTFINSLKDVDSYYTNSFNIPKFSEIEWINYKYAFTSLEYNNQGFVSMFFNSLWMSGIRVLVSIGCSTLTSYALARFRFPGKTLIYSIAIFIQVVPIIGCGAAGYVFMDKIGMINNPAAIWLSWAGGFDFAFIVLYGYFKGIAGSYSEAASIDGANQFTIMVRIIIPQAIPAIASLMILNFITYWNDYTTPLVYMRKYPTLALGIFSFKTMAAFKPGGETAYFAAVLLSALIPVIIYSSTQKMIMKNVTAGGLKG